jgi:AcrR family transcriptional regulator
MTSHSTFAPKQNRSRETLKRLLRAATEILETKGLEAATIPQIAARAGLSPGTVYRRFRDKDALLRTLVLETLRTADRHAEERLSSEAARQSAFPDMVRTVITTTLQSYRKHTRLLRAFTQFTRSHPSAAFRKQADDLEVRNFRRVAAFLLLKRSQIRHPNPELAVSFALMLVGLALREMVILDVLSPVWSPVMPKDDQQLAEELTRTFLSYLEFDDGHGNRHTR